MRLGYLGLIVLSSWAVDLRGGEEDAVELGAYLVTASPFVTSKEELVVPASSLSGEALARSAQSTLGGTLEGVPGVHTTYFGPGAGRPVIRGFDGGRVRILNQGTDAFDVSEVSPDHGVAIEPLFARNIEVVRGPALLLYGNAAIGGVVNVIGKELPREKAQRSFSGTAVGSYGSASDERSFGMALEGGEGAFAWSAGYLDRQSGNLEIPGFAESIYQMEAEEAEHEEGEEHEEEEEAFGVLENSFVETRSGYFGAGYFGEKSEWGVAYSKLESDYGVPGHSHEHEEEHEEEGHDEEDHDHEEESVSIDMDQSRVSFRGKLFDLGGFFESVELQGGVGDYEHKELEGDAVGTLFERDGTELRMTAVHEPVAGFAGAVGLHLREEAFDSVGEEASVPANESGNYGLFIVERLNEDWGSWEFGGRVESVDIDLVDGSLASRSFTAFNASAGFVRRVSEGSSVSANLTYAERAPNASELYAFGPHIGTRSFEIGSETLDKEVSAGVDMAYRVSAGFVTGELTAFFSDFGDYVYMRNLNEGEVSDLYGDLDTEGLPVLMATAVDARFYGVELDLRFHLIDEVDRSWHFDLMADQTRATNDSFDSNLPRIPTRRFGGRTEYAFGAWKFGLEGRFNEAASHLAPDEFPTDSYFLWGADVRYRISETDTGAVDLFVEGSNLGDEEARPHTSYLKDLISMPGRSVKLGLRSSW